MPISLKPLYLLRLFNSLADLKLLLNDSGNCMGRVAGPIIVHFYETLLGNVLFIQEDFLPKFDNQNLSYVGHKTLFSANIIVM